MANLIPSNLPKDRFIHSSKITRNTPFPYHLIILPGNFPSLTALSGTHRLNPEGPDCAFTHHGPLQLPLLSPSHCQVLPLPPLFNPFSLRRCCFFRSNCIPSKANIARTFASFVQCCNFLSLQPAVILPPSIFPLPLPLS